jgi:mRNA-degrading endonuclease RelE of RelBE toxin-antitoxin system
MNWEICFSKDSRRFLGDNHLDESSVLNRIVLVLRKFQGEGVSIDVKKLRGAWKEFYRIRDGKLRIIASFQFELHQVYIERIDRRGGVYKP